MQLSAPYIDKWINKYKLESLAHIFWEEAQQLAVAFKKEYAVTHNERIDTRPPFFIWSDMWRQWKINQLKKYKLQREVHALYRYVTLYLTEKHVLCRGIKKFHNEIKRLKIDKETLFNLHPYRDRFERLKKRAEKILIPFQD